MVTSAEKQRVGTLIKHRRQELGIRTQADLARLVGTSKTSVAKWESGKHYPDRYLGKLAAVLRISLTGPAAPDPVEEGIRALDGLPAPIAERLIELYRELTPAEPQPSSNGDQPHSNTV